MSRDFTERQIDNSEKIVIRDESSQKIQTVIFPHTTQVGLGDARYQSKLNVQGSIHSSGSLQLGELSATPEQPGDGSGGIFYVKSDGKPYFRSYEQAEVDLTTGGGGGSGDMTGVDLTAGTGIDISSETNTTSGDYSATIAVDVSDFMTNGLNNRIVTATTTDSMNAEANLTFNGSELLIAGSVKATSYLWSQRTDDGERTGLYLDNLSTNANATVSSQFRLNNSTSAIKQAGKILVGKVQDWNSDGNTDAYMSFTTIKDNAISEVMRLQNDRIGIGTTSPDEPLHAKESIATTGVSNSVLKLETFISDGFADGDGPGIKFSGGDSNASNNTIGRIFSARDGADNEGKLGFMAGTNGAEEFMTIKPDGKVGIGTTTPTCLFEVQNTSTYFNQMRLNSGGHAEMVLNTGGNYRAVVNFDDAGTTYYSVGSNGGARFEMSRTDAMNGTGFFVHNYSSKDITIGENIVKLYYDYSNSGRFGIGTNAPGKELDVYGEFQTSGPAPTIFLKNTVNEHGDGQAESSVKFIDHLNTALVTLEGSHEGSSNDTKGQLRFIVHDGSSETERMRLTSAGKLGIGTTDPTYEVDVRASSARLQVKSSGAAAFMLIDAATDNDSILYFRENGSNKWLIGNDATDDLFKFDNNSGFGSPAMTISTAGVVTATTFAGNATSASAVSTANNSADQSQYISFVDGATGNKSNMTDVSLRYNPSSNSLSIGTPTPDEPLHIREYLATSGASNSILKLETYSSNGFQDGDGPGIKFSGGDALAANNTIGRIACIREGADTEGKLLFMAGTNGAEQFMNISSAGNVGIGYPYSVSSAKFMVLGAMMSQRSSNAELEGLTLHNYNVGASAAASLRYILTDDAGDKNAARIKVGKVQDWNNAGNTDAYMSFSTIVDDSEAEAMRIQNGNIGIGTTTPSANLHITNTSGGKLLRLDTGANTGNDPQIFITGQGEDSVEGFALNYDNDTGDIRYDVYFAGSGGGDHIWRLNQDTNAGAGYEGMRLTGEGNVGIGTSTPAYKLHVLTDVAYKGEVAVAQINNTNANDGANFRMLRARGSKASPAIVQDGDSLGSIAFQGYDGSDYLTSGGQIWCEVDGTPAGNDMPGRLVFKTTPDDSSTCTERMRITKTGQVGIGIANPLGRLHQNGNHLIELNDDTNSSAGGHLKFFRTRGTNASKTTTSNNDHLGSIEFYGYDAGESTYGIAASIEAHQDAGFGDEDYPGRLVFKTTSDGGDSTSERMRLTSTGRLGVGTTSPSQKLHVAGTIQSTKHAIGTAGSIDNGINADLHIISQDGSDGTGIIIECDANQNEGFSYLDFIESPSAAGSTANAKFGTTNAYGFRWKLDASTNDLTLQSCNGTTVNDIAKVDRDTAVWTPVTYATKAISADVTTSDTVWMPISDQYYADHVAEATNRHAYVWMAPCDGKFVKIRAKFESSAGNSTFKMWRITAAPGGTINPTTPTGATELAATSTVNVTAGTGYSFIFLQSGDNNPSFSAGEIIGLTFDGTNTPNQVVASLLIQYDWSTV